MKGEVSPLLLVAIVAIVAIAGLAMLTMNQVSVTGGASSTSLCARNLVTCLENSPNTPDYVQACVEQFQSCRTGILPTISPTWTPTRPPIG